MPICAEPLAVVTSYDELVAAFRARIAELNTTYEGVDAVAGLADRHTNKLLCGLKNYGLVSLGLTLGALGLALVVVSDDEQLERVRSRLPQRRSGGDRRSEAFRSKENGGAAVR
jgi:hypothetical protein